MKLKFVFALALGLNTAVWCQSPAGLHTLKTAGIAFHGGPVLGTTATPSVYYIWYGNWTGNTGVQILTDLANHLGGSGYYNIITTYTDSNDASVVNALHYGGSTVDHYSLGRRLSQAMLERIVSNAITSAALPADTNAVYRVLTSADVLVAGFCTKFCGFHQHFELNGVAIKYAFVGNPAAQCLAGCAAQTVGPNGNAGADAMVSSLARLSQLAGVAADKSF